MREQRKNAPRTKPAILTKFAGSEAPTVTYSIIGVTLVVYVLQFVSGDFITNLLLYAGVYSQPANFEPWRLLTTALVHGSIFHVVLNMYTLWIFGQFLEHSLGRGRYITLYVLSALAGSLGVLLLADPYTPVVGASGAIFGLMGAFLVIQRRLGGNAKQLLVLIGINLVIGFIPNLNIAWQAHVGGIVGGAILGFIYVQTRHIRQKFVQTALIGSFAAVLVLLSFVRFFVN